MIAINRLTKRYGATRAVEDLSFTVRPGVVTGFLGANGAGKSTTLRMLVGLVAPTGGQATINGQLYRELADPARTVGALLDARATQPFRTATAHLRWIARTGRLDPARIGPTLAVVGLEHAAHRRIGDFSLGMRQRLGLAVALLGDPQVLVLDEPTNGLDPEGVAWLRTLLRSLAEQGRTVFLSSHLMGEMEHTADQVVIIDAGRFVADVSIAELTARTAGDRVTVVTPDPRRLTEFLEDGGALVDQRAGGLSVRRRSAAEIGDLALRHGIALHELHPERRTLEEAFLQITHDRPAPRDRLVVTSTGGRGR
jgi:ABC-2 type transport system ATP-binding protein